jgi:hypothetical protein
VPSDIVVDSREQAGQLLSGVVWLLVQVNVRDENMAGHPSNWEEVELDHPRHTRITFKRRVKGHGGTARRWTRRPIIANRIANYLVSTTPTTPEKHEGVLLLMSNSSSSAFRAA